MAKITIDVKDVVKERVDEKVRNSGLTLKAYVLKKLGEVDE